MTAQELNELISQNRTSFKSGSTIQEAELCLWFNINKPKKVNFKSVQQFAFKKLSAYTSLNKVLAYRGIVLKSRNYGTTYEVLTQPRVENKINNLHAEAQAKTARAHIIEAGKTAYRGRWSKLKKKEIKLIRNYEQYPLPMD